MAGAPATLNVLRGICPPDALRRVLKETALALLVEWNPVVFHRHRCVRTMICVRLKPCFGSGALCACTADHRGKTMVILACSWSEVPSVHVLVDGRLP